ncbi:MAG: 2-oxoacid:acceptor oxidoreductase family protein [Candidatus Firestonebacteria bacterium]
MESSVILCGSGGQGIQLAGTLLATAAVNEGKNVTWLPSYGAEKRGGLSYCAIVISDENILSPVIAKADTVIILDVIGFNAYKNNITEKGLFIINSSLVNDISGLKGNKKIYLPLNGLAKEAGNFRIANMAALGVYSAVTNAVKINSIIKALDETISVRHRDLLPINIKALESGYKEGVNNVGI